MRRTGKSFNCPVCGEEVPANAKSCPDCGACEKSGWSEDLDSSGLDLPDEDFDYEKFVGEEFGGVAKKSGKTWLWAIVAVLVLTALLLSGFFSR
jgi:hypothetical protein